MRISRRSHCSASARSRADGGERPRCVQRRSGRPRPRRRPRAQPLRCQPSRPRLPDRHSRRPRPSPRRQRHRDALAATPAPTDTPPRTATPTPAPTANRTPTATPTPVADRQPDAHCHANARANRQPDAHCHANARANSHCDARRLARACTNRHSVGNARTGANARTVPRSRSGRYTSLSVGLDHACALTEDGEAVCWGDNDHGQAEAPPGRYTAISAASAHTCAVTTGGEIVCWGRDIGEQPPPGRFEAVSTSGGHACALTEDGEAVCWGGLLNINDYGETDVPTGRYVAISLGRRGVEGGFHPANSCALTEDGKVVCWGEGPGNITDENGNRRPADDRALRFAGPYTSVASAAGFGFCAVTADGAAECWQYRPIPEGTLTRFEHTRTPGMPPAER